MDLQDILVAKEKKLLLPETRHSTTKLTELLSEKFVEIGQSGNKFGLDEILRDLPKEQGWSAEISGIEFRMLSDDIAQLLYTAVIRNNRDSDESRSKRSSIWGNESGVWRMLFHQGTRL